MKSLIEFSMAYSREQQELRVTILRCKDLKAADSNGLSDPYVNVFLAGGDPVSKAFTYNKL
jgi:Ca2+-dependent lipid-binding protein